MTTQPKTPESKPLVLSLIWIVIGLPYVTFATTFLATLPIAPGFLSVFFTSWLGFIYLIAAIAWHALGAFLLLRFFANKPISVRFALAYVSILVIFVCPMCLLPIIGPPAIALHDALFAAS